MNKDKEIKKIDFLLSRIEEINNTINNIENEIVEQDLDLKYVVFEFFIYLFINFFILFLMFYLKKYYVFFIVLMVLLGIVFFMYYLSIHFDNLRKEKVLNSLISDKLNLENILDTIPNKNDLIDRKKNLFNNKY